MMGHAVSEHLPSLIIPVPDFRTLRLVASDARGAGIQAATAAWLAGELGRATMVAPDDVPRKVVTLHTHLKYRDDATDQVGRMTLVYPGEKSTGTSNASRFSLRSVRLCWPVGGAIHPVVHAVRQHALRDRVARLVPTLSRYGRVSTCRGRYLQPS